MPTWQMLNENLQTNFLHERRYNFSESNPAIYRKEYIMTSGIYSGR